MKTKTIRKILREKMEDWLKSIDDLDVRQCARENVIVTGGSIPSMLLGEPINDFDLYMRTRKSTEVLAKYYVDKFNKAHPDKVIKPYVELDSIENIKGVTEDRVVIKVQSSGAAGEGDDSNYQYYEATDNVQGDGANQFINTMLHGDKSPDEEGEEKPRYRPVFMSQNAITLKNKIQLVIRFYGEPDEIHNNYDFQHAMCSYDHYNDDLRMPAEALECLLSKTLIYKGSLYPICSLFRLRKFIERGWKVSAGEILKISWQISEIDLTNKQVLREQLVGCDAAYFHQLIKLMDKHKEEQKDLEIDSAYIVQLVDKIFNV